MIQIDLEMPKCCEDCRLVYDNCWCMITGSRMDWEKSETERLPDCPLREIAKPTVLPIAEIHFDEDKMREICKEVAENLVVEYDFKGKTNGEVIKAVFPNFHTDEMSHTVWVGYDAMSFHRDWWDSPYEPQESEKPYKDWYDVPSDKMTLEQARQAVKDLRKKLAEYL